jgi:hypothetical protein
MKTIIQILIILIPVSVSAQKDAVWYFGVNGKITDANNWNIKKEVNFRGKNKISIKTFSFSESKEKVLIAEKIKHTSDNKYEIKVKGKLFSDEVLREYEKSGEKWRFTEYVKGNLIRTGITSSKFPLVLDGEVVEYYENGNKKSVSYYENNELISNKNWYKNGKKYVENVFYSVSQVPLFPQGMGTLHRHVLKTFRDSQLDLTQISGTIKVGFVVMKNGRLDGIRIEEGINETLNNLALQAFHTLIGDWEPATLEGEIVRCYQVFPINFSYTEYDYDYIDFSGGRLHWHVN